MASATSNVLMRRPLLSEGGCQLPLSMPSSSGASSEEEAQLLGADSSGLQANRSVGRGQGNPGTLLLRAADGIARNIVFANQIDVLQRYAGLGQNSAQQQAKFLSALCCSTPLVFGFASRRLALPLPRLVLVGVLLEVLGISILAAAAAGFLGSELVLVGLFGPYACGFGAITSTLPVLGMQEVPASLRPAFSQQFFACLSAGSILGILIAGAAQLLDAYAEAFALATLLLAGGATCFMLRRPPAGGAADKPDEGGDHKPDEGCLGRRSLWLLLMLVPFYAAYLQWTTSWYVQALAMNRDIFGVAAPACLLQIVERGTALILNIVLGVVLRDYGPRVSLEKRLAAGCSLAGLALVVSGVVERIRRAAPRLPGDTGVSSLSVGWLVPQFCSIAAAEAVVFPAQSEWAAGRPDLIGLTVVTQAAAAFALGLLLPSLSDWLPQSSINQGHYDLFFFSLAAGCAASAAVLLSVPSRVWGSSAS
mmetsp:Transcript_150825/g.482796  ORF Transcript_150825/g.482796 Transcript_150825/m.482796 type:complete len:479 (+) Transcript_150825:84-1520(+)